MPSYHMQTTLLTKDGNPENYQSNGFAIGQIGSLDLAGATNWVSYVKDLYDEFYTNGALRGMEQNNHVAKIYEIGQPKPNYPVFELNFDLATNPASIDLPMELSLCVSYYASAATTILRARRRGRIYVSGWAEVANDSGRPLAATPGLMADAYGDYVLACDALPNLSAGVWSRTNDTVYEVDTVWCDNEWDTQRRRGSKPTSRDTWIKP